MASFGVMGVLVLSLMGCQSHEKVMPFEAPPLKWTHFERPKFEPRRNIEPLFISAPDQRQKPEPVSGFEDVQQLSKMISLKVERMWTEKNQIKFIVSLKNDTDKGTRATFYRFGHDVLGRIVSTKRKEIFFKPHESIFESFSFSKTGIEAHWSFSVK
jgi:hypothetical protein